MKTAAKDFKKTELGPIPKDWEVKRLGEIWKRFATGPFGSSLHASDYVSGGTPLVNPMHIVEGKIIPDKEMTVDCVTRKRLASYQMNAGDLVMGRRGEMGRVAVVTKKEQGWLCGTGSFTITLRDNESPDFVARYLRTPQCVAEMTNEAVGTTIQNLNQTLVSQINIAYPPLPEQRKIAAALSDVDEMIAALEKLIEKKRKIKTGAMQRLLTGKTRLPGFKGAWVEKRLGDCADIRTGKRNGDEQTPSGMYPFFVRSQVVYRIDSYSFDGEAILVPGEGGIGSIFHYINGKFDYHQRVYKISDFTDGVCGKFLFHYLKRYFGEWALSQTVKATVDSLRLPTFENFIMIVPPTLAEQKAIAKVLGDMDEEIAALEAELAKTRQLKQGMMQELLTGKTRL